MVGGHSLDMFQYAMGDFTEISATLATRIDRITMEETGGPIEVTSPDQIALGGLLESGAADRGARADGPTGPGLAGRLPGGTPPDPDPCAGRRLPRPAAHRPRRTPPDAGHPLPRQPTDPARAIRTGDDFGPDFTTAVRVHRLHPLLDAVKSSARSGSRVRLG